MKLLKNIVVVMICLLSFSVDAAGVKQRPTTKGGAAAPLAPLPQLDQFRSISELTKLKLALQAKRSELSPAQQRQIDAQIEQLDSEITKRRTAEAAPKKPAAKVETPKVAAQKNIAAKYEPGKKVSAAQELKQARGAEKQFSQKFLKPAEVPASKAAAPKVAVAPAQPKQVKNISQLQEQAIEQANKEIASVEVKSGGLEEPVEKQMFEEVQKAFPDENAPKILESMSAQLEDEIALKFADLLDLLGEKQEMIPKKREFIKKKQALQQLYRKMAFQMFDSLINKIRPIRNTFFQNYPGTQLEKEEAWQKVVMPIRVKLE